MKSAHKLKVINLFNMNSGRHILADHYLNKGVLLPPERIQESLYRELSNKIGILYICLNASTAIVFFGFWTISSVQPYR